MALAGSLLQTRFGALAVVVDDAAPPDRPAPAPGAVVASGLRGLPSDVEPVDPNGHPLLAFAAAAVAAWESGADLAALDRVPVHVPGSGFRTRVWVELRDVPAGEVIAYGELAELAGNRRAARAAGRACASNPLAPFVPCHRVVRRGGVLGEYGYGARLKRAMLVHEGAWE